MFFGGVILGVWGFLFYRQRDKNPFSPAAVSAAVPRSHRASGRLEHPTTSLRASFRHA